MSDNRRTLALHGLNCGYCSTAVADEVKMLPGVKDVSFDHAAQTLEIDTDDIDAVIDRINQIVARHSHKIEIKEKVLSKTKRKIFLMVGLSCANCAMQIERKVSGLAGVISAKVNFASGSMILETEEGADLEQIQRQASGIASSVDRGISLMDSDRAIRDEGNRMTGGRIRLIRLALAAALLIVAITVVRGSQAQFAVFVLAYLTAGYDILFKAFRNISKGIVFDENFLMSVATAGAFIIGEYPEAAAVMLFYQVGDFLQELAVSRSGKAIRELSELRPDTARLVSGNEIDTVDAASVKKGDIILVKPGERVPLDGIVISGASYIDVSALTGEPLPAESGEGSEVLSGSINIGNAIKIKVTKEFHESAVSRILELVRDAGARKSHTEKLMTRLAAVYTPVVTGAAVIIAFAAPVLIPGESLAEWVRRALVFLVASCPCALVLSIPLSFFSGIGAASAKGILVKGGDILEKLAGVDTVVFDKTGTLTEGRFAVKKINAVKADEKDVLRYAALAESYSGHPAAGAILEAYGMPTDKDMVEAFEELYGYGVKAKAEGKDIAAGNFKLMQKEKIDAAEDQNDGITVYVAVNGEYIGNIVVGDSIKSDSHKALKDLKASGVKRTVMFTGDSRKNGMLAAKELNIDEVYAEMLPHQKAEQLEELIKNKDGSGMVAFMGDGVNDAPVLARADIGIAVVNEGLGSDAAIKSADTVIRGGEPSKLAKAIKIAKKTKRIAYQNICFALAVKGAVLILGAAGSASMWEAVIADVGVSMIAVANSLRLLAKNT